MPPFELSIESSKSRARSGFLNTAHGRLETPFFMPIATRGAVKTLSALDIKKLGSPTLLSNTYHLMLRPGAETMKALGGLHKFVGFDGMMLTDSGGFQVFSLAELRKVTEDGVYFSSPIDGSKHLLTPESSIGLQRVMGSDIVMCFDE